MPLTTYNPISEPFDTMPKRRPGTVVVSYSNGIAEEVVRTRNGSEHFAWIKSVPLPALIVALVVSVFSLFVFGFIFTFILLLLSVGGLVYLKIDNSSPVARLLFGALPEYYLVDISRRTISDMRRAQLSDPGVYIIVTFEYKATISNAVAVVENGVRDVREYSSDKFYKYIDETARVYSLANHLELREKFSDFFVQAKNDELIKLDSITFDMQFEGAPQQAMTRLSEAMIREREIRAKSRLEAVEREELVKVIGNNDSLLAEVMRSDDQRVRELLKIRIEQRNISFQQNLALFKAALENGVLEAHQIKRDYPDFFAGLMGTIPTLVSEQMPALPPAQKDSKPEN